MLHVKKILSFWKENMSEDLVLATIVGKTGSGYRSAGAKKIIRKDGLSCGTLSGGCLEGDIVRMAVDNWDALPVIKSFSTMSDEDRLMGYQTGCAGILDILFEKLPSGHKTVEEYIPFGTDNKDICAVALCLEPERLAQRKSISPLSAVESGKWFIDPWIFPVSLYVVGCGPDAASFAEQALSLGWDANFIDYRQGYKIDEKEYVRSYVVPLGKIADAVPEGSMHAVVLMTHNYEADMAIMKQMNGKKFGYAGCVGPRRRFEQMKQDLKSQDGFIFDEDWARALHAPAGLWQRHTPETIAFSIIAEIESVLGQKA